MRRPILILSAAISTILTVGVNFGIIRGVMAKIGRPANKCTATLLALAIATIISVPNIRHGNRFAELTAKSTENMPR